MLAVMGSLVLASDMVEGIAFLEWEDGELAKVNQDHCCYRLLVPKRLKQEKFLFKDSPSGCLGS